MNPADQALELIKKECFVEAQQLLFGCLSGDPFNPRLRVLLARVFFELNYLPFAIRELEQAHQELPNNRYVKNLLTRLAPEKVTTQDPSSGPSGAVQDKTIAEVDFDIGDLEDLEKEGKH